MNMQEKMARRKAIRCHYEKQINECTDMREAQELRGLLVQDLRELDRQYRRNRV